VSSLQLIVFTALLGLLGPGIAWAQVVVDPPSPKAFFEVRVKVDGKLLLDLDGQPDTHDPAQTTVLMVGNKITVSPLMVGKPDFATQLPAENVDQTLGSLPPGTYQVEVVRRATGRGTPGPIGDPVTFTVAPRDTTDPIANFTGIWWRPSEPGWGLGIFQHPSNRLFATLFVYGTDGKPTWYVIPGAFTSPLDFQGTIYRTTGPYFGGEFDPAAVSAQPVGTAEIGFNSQDLNFATILFTIQGVSFNKVIERQPF